MIHCSIFSEHASGALREHNDETATRTRVLLCRILRKRISRFLASELLDFRTFEFWRQSSSLAQNRTFIYRGKEYERLSEFASRVMMSCPNAQKMTTTSPPSEQVKESDGMCILLHEILCACRAVVNASNSAIRFRIVPHNGKSIEMIKLVDNITLSGKVRVVSVPKIVSHH